MCQLDPCVSIIKVGNLSGDHQSRGVWRAVKTGRIYGWAWRNVVVGEKEREERHELGGKKK